MKVVSFIAENPAAALAQIHQRLGPEAVVLSVRPLPSQGLSRLWQKTRAVEVLACVAEEGDRVGPPSQGQAPSGSHTLHPSGLSFSSPLVPPALHDGSARPHVLVGPPGTGKTTLLCKWMTLSVLNENRPARVWRLDGPSANTAEFLNIYAEMLGISLERFWNPSVQSPAFRRPGDQASFEPGETCDDLLLVDLPGVQPSDTDALQALRNQVAVLPAPRVHLVLNAAYETSILAEQFRAFSAFQPEDLSFTHLDEEKGQAKLLDFIQGTNCCLRFLSTGQKIPGDLVLAGASFRTCPELAA
jgi:flagellar biosynthesis protein FlhF